MNGTRKYYNTRHINTINNISDNQILTLFSIFIKKTMTFKDKILETCNLNKIKPSNKTIVYNLLKNNTIDEKFEKYKILI